MSNHLVKLSVNSVDAPMPWLVMGNTERSSVMRTCNDYDESQYKQVLGSAEYPAMDKEIVSSIQECVAARNGDHELTTHGEDAKGIWQIPLKTLNTVNRMAA